MTSLRGNASAKPYTADVASGLSDLSSEWQKLVESAVDAEPFFHPEWIRAFAESFEQGGEIVCFAARLSGALVGVLPLVRTEKFFGRLPGRTLRSVSGVHSCRYDLISSVEHAVGAADAIWQALRDDPTWDVIEALDVPLDGTFGNLMTHAEDDGFLTSMWPMRESPFLELPAPGGDPFSNSPSNYRTTRNRVGNALKKLEKEGDVSCEVLSELGPHGLAMFLDLEARGWKGQEGGAILCRQDTIDFYSRVIPWAESAGILRAYLLRLNDSVVAMDLGLSMHNRFYAPKTAYDERFRRFSPGQLLNRFEIIDLVSAGFKRYDFLGSRSRYKSVWSNRVRAQGHHYIFRPTSVGRVRHALVHRAAPLLKSVKQRWWTSRT